VVEEVVVIPLVLYLDLLAAAPVKFSSHLPHLFKLFHQDLHTQ